MESILVSCHAGIGTITLNRPDALNSLNKMMHETLRNAMSLLAHDDDCRVLVITGAGRGFCAGQDLNDRQVASNQGESHNAIKPDLGESIATYYAPLIQRLVNFPKPVIAAVNGVAAGAGANIALACDCVIAKESASFIQAFCKIGLMPDSGGTFFLPRLVGTANALALCLLGDKISAIKAAEMGMIWQAVPDVDFEKTVQDIAIRLKNAPTQALITTRSAIRNTSNHLSEQLLLEGQGQSQLGMSDDYQEGVAAFLEKRAPQFGKK